MKIALCGSMVFTDKMFEVKAELEKLGHKVLISDFAESYRGKSQAEQESLTIKDKLEKDAIREFWTKIEESDAVLVLNYDRKGIKGYIGGNSLMEIGFAYILRKKIFLLNPVPEIPYYKSEIEATKPIILLDGFSKLS